MTERALEQLSFFNSWPFSYSFDKFGKFCGFSFPFHSFKNLQLSCFCRISDCSDHVASIFTGSHDFVIQAFSAMLLAKLVSSDSRLLVDQVEHVLEVVSTALARLPQFSQVTENFPKNNYGNLLCVS